MVEKKNEKLKQSITFYLKLKQYTVNKLIWSIKHKQIIKHVYNSFKHIYIFQIKIVFHIHIKIKQIYLISF